LRSIIWLLVRRLFPEPSPLRRVAHLGIAALALSACHHARVVSGDESPYPALDPAALDRSTPPCQDFYQFACGGWIAANPVPPDRIEWVRGTGELEERNERLLRRILDDAASGKVDARDRFGRKAGDFYATCMDEAGVEASGLANLQAEWSRLDAAQDRAEVASELARLEALGLHVPFALSARPDPADRERALLVLGVDGAGPAGGEVVPLGPASLEAYGAHARAALRLGGLPPDEADREAEAALEVERALLLAPEEDPGAPAREPVRVDRSGLEGLAPGFPWERLFESIGAEHLPVLGVADVGAAARAGRVFAEAPIDGWKAYLRLHLSDALSADRALPTALEAEWLGFRRALLPAPLEPRPRWKHCVEVTARVFAFATGETFAWRHLGVSGRERAEALVRQVLRGARRAIWFAPWMDGPTRTRAADKLEGMAGQVGFPDAGIPDYNDLKVGRDSYFRNLLSAGRFAVAREVGRAGLPLGPSDWLIGPFSALPAYSPGRNILTVPAGALQPPLYIADAPAAVILGAAGTAVARPLIEAIVGEGRHRGPNGSLDDWWTPETQDSFSTRLSCLADEYASYEPGRGQGLERNWTAAEAFSEEAAVRVAYEALQAERVARPAPEKRLLGFTADQQFFLGYAQSLCTAVGAVVTEPGRGREGPLARLAVNGVLSNILEFAKAFRCESGSPMARPLAARCEVW